MEETAQRGGQERPLPHPARVQSRESVCRLTGSPSLPAEQRGDGQGPPVDRVRGLGGWWISGRADEALLRGSGTRRRGGGCHPLLTRR
jgi:hypothetical protein